MIKPIDMNIGGKDYKAVPTHIYNELTTLKKPKKRLTDDIKFSGCYSKATEVIP